MMGMKVVSRQFVVSAVVVAVMVWAAPLWAQLGEREVEQRLELARKYLHEGNLRLAEQNAQRALDMAPGDLAAQEILDTVARARNNQVTATGSSNLTEEDGLLARWRDQQAAEDDRREAGNKLSDLYLEQAQNLIKRRGNAVEALLLLRKGRLLNPDNAWIHYELFKLFEQRKRYEECLAPARRFLELVNTGVVAMDVRRKLVEVQMEIGDHYVKESRWDRAAKHFREVLRLEPPEQVADEATKKLGTALVTLFYGLHGKQQYVEAAEYLDQLMELRPLDPAQRTAFDAEHFNKVRRYAPDVFWAAVPAMRERRKFDIALNYIARLLECGPSTARRQEALQLKERIMEDQAAAQGNATTGAAITAHDDTGGAAAAAGEPYVAPPMDDEDGTN